MESSKLPRIYRRNGKECYLDPIREKLIYITPEEKVRQEVISYLLCELGVPKNMLYVEQHLTHYGIDTKKRADIVVDVIDKDGLEHPLAVVECKAPDVELDEKAQRQVLEYCDILGVDYAMLTNGIYQFCFKYDEGIKGYRKIVNLPVYKKMIAGEYQEMEIGELPPRIPFDKLDSFLQETFSAGYEIEISEQTPRNIAVATFNLWEGLLDTRVKMPTGDYGLFRLIEDYGVRMLSYGNAAGGKFFGPYRSFLVEVNGNTEFYSIGVSTYMKSTSPDKVKTCIAVAHDDEKEAHHALQLVVDDNLIIHNRKVDFFHHGKIAIGKMGSGKIDELRMFVDEKCPQLIYGNKFYFGSLVNDRLWRLDDSEVIKVISNLISYSMIRDEYRAFVKGNNK